MSFGDKVRIVLIIAGLIAAPMWLRDLKNGSLRYVKYRKK